jgi:hypothetical protein
MNAKSVSTYDERDIIVDREREGARTRRSLYVFRYVRTLPSTLSTFVSNSASQAPLLRDSGNFAQWLIDSGKVQVKAARMH